MKKALSILLALAMLFAVTACSNNQQGELPKDDQKQAAGTTQDEQKPAGDEAKDPVAQTVAQYYNTYMVADPTSMDISLNAEYLFRHRHQQRDGGSGSSGREGRRIPHGSRRCPDLGTQR